MHPIVTWKWSLVLARCYRCWRTWIQGFILPFYLLYLSSTNIVYWVYSSLCAVYMYYFNMYLDICIVSISLLFFVTYRKCFASNYCASISVNVYTCMYWCIGGWLDSCHCIVVHRDVVCIQFLSLYTFMYVGALNFRFNSATVYVVRWNGLANQFLSLIWVHWDVVFSCSVTLTLVTVDSIIMMECIDVHSIFSFRDRACTIGLVGGWKELSFIFFLEVCTRVLKVLALILSRV